MNYHFKNKNLRERKKSKKYYIFLLFLVLFILALGFFGNQISERFKGNADGLIIISRDINEKFDDFLEFMNFRSNLIIENRKHKSDIFNLEIKLKNYEVILEENNKLKNLLEMSKDDEFETIFANVLISPPITPNDILVLDVGENKAVKEGNFVKIGKIGLGVVSEVFENTSRVKMFSTSDTEVVGRINDSKTTIIGSGGGNFDLEVPRDLDLNVGDNFFFENIFGTFLVAEIKDIEETNSSYLKEVLLSVPINILKIQTVQVTK